MLDLQAKDALIHLNCLIGELRALFEADPDTCDKLVAESPQYAEPILGCVLALDDYLTGGQPRHCPSDRKDLDKFLLGEDWLVYLSDGGYSRLFLQWADPEGRFVTFDAGAGWPKNQATKNRWLALQPED